MKTLLSHRSIRKYQNRPIEKEILDEILKAVQAAPNWVNLQHISVIVVQEQQRRKKFAELCGGQKHCAGPCFSGVLRRLLPHLAGLKENGQEFDSVVSQIDNLIVGANEVGIALGTAVVAAESFGLGTVPIGDIRLHAFEAIRELNLPKDVVPMLGLCVGYPAEEPGNRNPACRRKRSALRKNIILT